MANALDIALYALIVFVSAGMGYAVLISILIGSWPDDAPGPVKEGCLLFKGMEWCTQTNALAWAIDKCEAEAEGGGEADYAACVSEEFERRGGEAGALSAAMVPALEERGLDMWDLAGERPGG